MADLYEFRCGKCGQHFMLQSNYPAGGCPYCGHSMVYFVVVHVDSTRYSRDYYGNREKKPKEG